jgi:hypothetical protein
MLRLLIENDVHLIYYYILTPLPGTDLRREFEEKNLLTNRDRWDHYDTLHVNFDPRLTSNGAGFTADELEQTIWRYYDSFYRYKYIARRLIRNFGRELKQPTVRHLWKSLPVRWSMYFMVSASRCASCTIRDAEETDYLYRQNGRSLASKSRRIWR